MYPISKGVPMAQAVQEKAPTRLRSWLLADLDTSPPPGPHAKESAEHQRPWWQVMCLTGLDYFSTSATSRASPPWRPVCCRRSRRWYSSR